MDIETWWATVHGVAESQTWQSEHAYTVVEVVQLSASVILAVTDCFVLRVWRLVSWVIPGFSHGRAGDSPSSCVESEPEECPGVLALEPQSPGAGKGTRQELVCSQAPEQMAACFRLRRWLGPALCGRAWCSPFLVSHLSQLLSLL